MILLVPMAMKCALCGKGVQTGHNVSHSKRRTAKTWKPNLQNYRIVVDENGNRLRVKLCVKCLRMAKEDSRAILQRRAVKNLEAPKVEKQSVI
jgi:large subunit ribosomal protein L28